MCSTPAEGLQKDMADFYSFKVFSATRLSYVSSVMTIWSNPHGASASIYSPGTAPRGPIHAMVPCFCRSPEDNNTDRGGGGGVIDKVERLS